MDLRQQACVFVACSLALFSGPVQAQGSDDASAASAVEQLLQTPAFLARLEAEAPLSTGDALFDRYATEIWRRNAPGAYLGQDVMTGGCLPDELLAQWEPEFGSDPRYWELRSFCAEAILRHAEAEYEDQSRDGPDPTGFLRTAIDRGVHRAQTVYGLLILEAGALRQRSGASWPSTVASEFDPGWEDVLLPLAERLIVDFPEQAEGWYSLALLHWERGDKVAAMTAVHRGNSTQLNDGMSNFPLDFVLGGMAEGKLHGSSYICGMVIGSSQEFWPLHFIFAKHLLPFERRLDEFDVPSWQPIHEWGIRVAKRPSANSLSLFRPLMYSRTLSERLLIQRPQDFTEAERTQLVRYVSRGTRMHQLMLRLRTYENRIERELIPRMFGTLGDQIEYPNMTPSLGVALALRLALDPEGFRAEWFQNDMGWAFYKLFAEARFFEISSEDRESFLREVEHFAKWSWAELDSIKTPEEIEREAALEAFADRLEQLSEAEAVAQLTEILEQPE